MVHQMDSLRFDVLAILKLGCNLNQRNMIYIFWSHSINNVIKSFEVSFICGIQVYMFCESHSIQGSFVQAKYFRFYDFFTIRGGHLMLAFRVMVICWPCPDGHYEYFRMSGLDLFVGSVC